MTGSLQRWARIITCSQSGLQMGELIVTAGLDQQADFCYLADFLPSSIASSYMHRLWQDLQWSQQDILLFGRRIPQPRLISWCGDPDSDYSYSGLQLKPLSWQPCLSELRNLLQEKLECSFNSVLANAYRDGRDSMGWHADDEKELGARPLIASLSLGASRRFMLREKVKNKSTPVGLQLEHGSLLVMQGDSQSRYLHSVPKTARPVGLRINLTFRQIFRQ